MTIIKDITDWMERLAPLRLTADWDNTGLLLGDLQRSVRRVMTCLTLTSESVAEAVVGRADLVISHHPLPFRPIKKITSADATGRLLWELASAGVSVYCPHTAWDSAANGINVQLAARIPLSNVIPLLDEEQPKAHSNSNSLVESQPARLGTGRCGDLKTPWR